MARTLLTIWLAGALGAACFSACGGSSDSDSGSAGDAGARTNGGAESGAGGAGASNAGRTSGGSANAGSANGGSADAGSANAGSANAGSANGGSANAGRGSGGSAEAGSGTGGSAEGGSSDGSVCGGLRGGSCTTEQWCDVADDAQCGTADQSGICRARPIACTKDCPGVCGCDGTTYCNRCEASAAGVDTARDGACEPQSCTTDENCPRTLRCCYPCGIPGCSMQCMRPAANGECPLFP